jgi:protein TonB
MAPPADRRLSAALSVLVYGLLGGGLALAATVKHEAVRRLITQPVLLRDPGAVQDSPKPPVEARLDTTPTPALARLGDGTRPKDVEATEVIQSPDQVPDATPDRLSTDDHATDGMYTKDMKVGTGQGGDPKGSTLPGAGTVGTASGVPGGGGPVFVDSAAVRVLSQVQPHYPQMAKLTGIQGLVQLRMTIDAQGVPTDVQILSGHPALTAEAVRAARLWRFSPAMVGGQAVPAVFNLTINFSLRG